MSTATVLKMLSDTVNTAEEDADQDHGELGTVSSRGKISRRFIINNVF